MQERSVIDPTESIDGPVTLTEDGRFKVDILRRHELLAGFPTRPVNLTVRPASQPRAQGDLAQSFAGRSAPQQRPHGATEIQTAASPSRPSASSGHVVVPPPDVRPNKSAPDLARTSTSRSLGRNLPPLVPAAPRKPQATTSGTGEVDGKSTSAGNWFPFAGEGDKKAIFLKGLRVSQLPRPMTEVEREQQRREWSTAEPVSTEEVTSTYNKLVVINTETLQGHRHAFPTLEVFSSHYERLPKWARDLERPRWRSPVDEALNAREVDKIWRYIYTWWFTLPLDEVESFARVLGDSKWQRKATEYGCGKSFATMKQGVTKIANEARTTGAASVDVLRYTGMGAGSEQQVNDSCRAFAHLDNPGSLFGLCLGIVEQYQTSSETKGRLYQSILSHLPLAQFCFSRRIFMFAESIFAVVLESAPCRGGANVLSCGQVDISSSWAAHLGKFYDTDRIAKLVEKPSISVACILTDRAEKLGARTASELRSKLRKTEKGEIATLGDGAPEKIASERVQRAREEEEALIEKERQRFGKFDAMPVAGSKAQWRLSETFNSSSTSRAPSVLVPTSRPTLLAADSPHSLAAVVAKTKQLHGIPSLDWPALEILARRELPYDNDNLDTIVSNLAHCPLPVRREAVTHLLARLQFLGGSLMERTFDNFVTFATLSSPTGLRVVPSIGVGNQGVGTRLRVHGIGPDAITGEIVGFALKSETLDQSTKGNAFVLKWSQSKLVLSLFEEDGRTPVLCRAIGRSSRAVEIAWGAARLKNASMYEGTAKILNL